MTYADHMNTRPWLTEKGWEATGGLPLTRDQVVDVVGRLVAALDDLECYEPADGDLFVQAVTDVCDLLGLPYPLLTHVEDCDCEGCAQRYGLRRVEDVPGAERAGVT